ncbi:MAG: ankyrin repeat domain-containing protein [Ferruginibacter sp.]|nr:ankyrin repeat domain-containing protein [Chitinophagaceae bacterium]
MDYLEEIAVQIELHSVEGIRDCFLLGVNPNAIFKGQPLIYELTSEYTRSPRFKDCVKAFVDHGLQLEDPVLLAVLSDDSASLNRQLGKDPRAVSKKYALRCAYTPLFEVTLLHICAEFNHRSCAEVLVQHGIDINAKAGTDKLGFGGQTPLFHTVNQNGNQSADMMDYLLSQSADLTLTVPGLIWGKGYDWETLIPSVNPVSYAMMGLLPQMHRDEVTTSKIVFKLLEHAYGIHYTPENVPCKYLKT